jgi:hypothetical protein
LTQPAARPEPHLVVGRRTAARAVWRGYVSATTNASVQVTQLLSWRPRPVPRHKVWAATTVRTVNAAGIPTGSQPGGLVVHRRLMSGLWGGAGVAGSNAAASTPVNGTVPAHLVIARRSVPRISWRGTITRTVNQAPSTPVNGNAPVHLTIVHRAISRAVWHGVTVRTVNQAAASPVNGSAPRHVVIVRRTATRGKWYGTTVRTVNGQPPPSNRRAAFLVFFP